MDIPPLQQPRGTAARLLQYYCKAVAALLQRPRGNIA